MLISLMLTVYCATLSPTMFSQVKTIATADTTLSQEVDLPETVIITYLVKAGKENEMATLIKRHWTTITKLGLMIGDFHHVFRGEDDSGKTFFVEIFTWKSHAAPDTAPVQVTEIWNAMQLLVEPRLGHDGIEYPEVHEVNSGLIPAGNTKHK